ncbi:unnamed protein product (macronuclear) [Paramecium tetraurelia]|uniref:Chromosome undetermined scaffold_89, whole genome shotgun sequence n=1 Tax=Paramecium tetraurelia TaxID=5888 RepID=Q3SD80_PARTE|nr:uncharacterized protein GSPATT00025673001 [Paramecium tetraurelia]CAI44485.1 rab_C70 [Paramecium tetraurelia]CAK92936.1 unnamed protein product [Paramecium tetraurelia]|eukprot:XP_001460333.1 hypothetical protein (macronuclear) [Paramecium tetraurelia strain d4-2]
MDEPGKPYDELYKIILVGDSSVGKTSYLIRLTKNVIKKQSQPTIGVEYAAQSILLPEEGKIVKSVIWDTAGAEKYKAITTAHYRKSEGALLFYDLSDKNSFDNVLSWRQEIIQYTEDSIVIMLVGNKLDLIQENPSNRCVSVNEVQQVCSKYNMIYYETSAKEGTNVKESFEQLIRKIYEHKQQCIEEEKSSNHQDYPNSEHKSSYQPLVQSNFEQSIQIKKQSDTCCGTQ